MYAVSLLPSEYKKLINVQRRNDKLIFIGLISALGTLILLVTTLAISSVYDNELTRAKSDNKMIMKQIDKFKPIEQLQTQVSNMILQVNQAAGLSPEWKKLITDIGNSISPKISFTSITAKYKDTLGILVIIGTASNQDEVSKLIQGLSSVTGLGEVRLKSSSIIDPTISSNVSFELNTDLIKGFPYELTLGVTK